MNLNRQEVIRDCKYAKSLGSTALDQHTRIWKDMWATHPNLSQDDREYSLTISEIVDKLHTDECLLVD